MDDFQCEFCSLKVQLFNLRNVQGVNLNAYGLTNFFFAELYEKESVIDRVYTTLSMHRRPAALASATAAKSTRAAGSAPWRAAAGSSTSPALKGKVLSRERSSLLPCCWQEQELSSWNTVHHLTTYSTEQI
jgi:hypothetical protein